MRVAIATPSNEDWRLCEPNNELPDRRTDTVSHRRAAGSKHTAAAACRERFAAGGDVGAAETQPPTVGVQEQER